MSKQEEKGKPEREREREEHCAAHSNAVFSWFGFSQRC